MRLAVITHSPEETQDLGAEVGTMVWPGLLLLLVGPLGAGKTRFVQGLARGMGVKGPVTSPSFILVQVHRGRIPLVHADLYRLEDPAEVEELGLWEYVSTAVLAIEWAERLGTVWEPHLRVEISPRQGGEREINLIGESSGDPRYGELLHHLAARRNLTVEEGV